MKLLFKKEEGKISIFINHNSVNENFDYIKMINYLINEDKFEGLEFDGDFSADEKRKLEEMTEQINEVVFNEKNKKEGDNILEDPTQEISAVDEIDTSSDMRVENIPF